MIIALVVSPFLSTMDSGDRTITVAAIQGSVPRLGLDFNSQRKQVLDNHVAETVKLAAEVDAGRVDQPDVVIWPENASDIDPPCETPMPLPTSPGPPKRSERRFLSAPYS